LIYLDSAAIVKLIRLENESSSLSQWLDDRLAVPRVTSALAEVEVPRAIMRTIPLSVSQQNHQVFARIARVKIDIGVRGVAAKIGDRHLRSLDAIHLASAMRFGSEIQHFVTYDKRLLQAAAAAGFSVISPGVVT
jgi:predicted nucleic acid-binding protein